MNTKILRFGTREAVKHPQGALRMSAAALRYRKAILAGMAGARQASQYGATVKKSAANPKVRAEARLALMSLALAGQRARQVGISDVSRDKRVAAQLRQAQRHAAKALATARRPSRRDRVVRTTRFVVGAGAVGGAAYAGWKVRPQPQQPETAPRETTAVGASTTDGGAAA